MIFYNIRAPGILAEFFDCVFFFVSMQVITYYVAGEKKKNQKIEKRKDVRISRNRRRLRDFYSSCVVRCGFFVHIFIIIQSSLARNKKVWFFLFILTGLLLLFFFFLVFFLCSVHSLLSDVTSRSRQTAVFFFLHPNFFPSSCRTYRARGFRVTQSRGLRSRCGNLGPSSS